MNADDIRNVTFDKVMRGYRPEEVDAYLAQVAGEMEKLQAEKEDNEKKLFILAEKVDQYRNDEETLKTALLNAQRMGESVIHEARQKAETILYDANSKANQLKQEAADNVAEMEQELARLKTEVAQFKSNVLMLYRQHIESLSAVPGEEKPKKEQEEEKKPRSHRREKTSADKNKKQVVNVPEKEEDLLELPKEPTRELERTPFDFEAEMPQSNGMDGDEEFESYQGIKFDED
ncbi:DivIVA domain-containing protein [uncultured Ruthenibacterium sp.]|uniref:DivIVA domain-containing protein n=1 Tax=uncultured Ruthenibacterium sp. TaxID=1905347 RepID=UPI00349EE99D